MGRQIHRQLLVADGLLQRRLVRRLQVRQQLLLLLFAAADQRQFAAKLVVAAASGKLMGKPDVFKFRAVHQDDPRPGVRIHRPLVVGCRPELLPIHKQLGVFLRVHFKRIHNTSLLRRIFARSGWIMQRARPAFCRPGAFSNYTCSE